MMNKLIEEQIKREVEERVRFKMEQIFTSIQNHARNYSAQSFSPKLSGRQIMEAVKNAHAMGVFAEIVENEIIMGVPSENMYDDKIKERRDIAVEEMMDLFHPQDLMRGGLERKVKSVVHIIEKALQI